MKNRETTKLAGGRKFYHVAFAVPDIEAAMDSLTQAVGLAWNAPSTATLGGWTYQIVFTTNQPFIELISGPAGSPWDTTTTGARFDHLGWWAKSLTGTVEDWTQGCGLQLDFDGRTQGRPFAYVTAEALGVRLEIVDASRMADFLSTWSPSTDPTSMDVLGQA